MATCSSPPIPDKNASGDNWYGQDICRQDMIDYFWINIWVQRQQGVLGERVGLARGL
jgi:hypothetical protein